ncbi:OmpA family protein [Aquimarina sp. MMG016]|uniref:OmpA family protein n=1 Tax=Aquimarina sp. MMG016 TaxID=2822690 RepID=UPI001B39CF3E|nr:OmpA family protein [Aquimarina sp. MMG016]MBQ4821275.1 OmpA family protein [Aquimarina sp. MMG016]
MPIGIEKVVYIDDQGQEQSPQNFAVRANEAIELHAKYYPETPEALTGHAKWIIKADNNTPFSIADQQGLIGDIREISIKPKYCGPQEYVIEAFTTEPTNTYPAQIKLNGIADPKIISTTWSTSKGGSDIRNSPIKYGDDVWLNVQTEGLNGSILVVEIYNRQLGDDEKVHTITNVQCINGEVNLNIDNTYTWRAGTGWNTSNNEEFYIKIKIAGRSKTIVDNRGQDIHARYLRFKDEISTRSVGNHMNAKPLTVGENPVNVERYELCKFVKIGIDDDGTGEIPVFNEGDALEGNKTESLFSQSVHFDLDKADIRSDAASILDGIANILLDDPYTRVNLGAHCDIRYTHEHNDALSQRRANAAVEYLVNKGVNKENINAIGYGKRRLLIPGENLTEEQHQQNRRVTVEFKVLNGSFSTINFDTIAPSKDKNHTITINIDSYNTDKCLREDTNLGHDTMVRIKELTMDRNGTGVIEKSGTAPIQQVVYSTFAPNGKQALTYLEAFNYFWPINANTNNYKYYINSCRYYADKNNPTLIIKAYPDIKWELAIEIAMEVSNRRSTNMERAGGSFAQHFEKNRQDGYARYLIGKQGRLPIGIAVKLGVEWNGGQHKKSFSNEFKGKIEPFAKSVSTAANLIQNAVNLAIGVAKRTAIPISLNILYPKFVGAIVWYLKREEKTKKIAVTGELSLSFKPLIGARAEIDLIAVAILVGSAGNPAVANLASKVRGGLAELGTGLTFTLAIIGRLNFSVEAIKFDTINGADFSGKTTIGGELGAEIEFILQVGFGSSSVAQAKPIINFTAAIKGEGYFGGELEFDSDDNGVFVKPTLKFSGVKITGYIKAEVGWWLSPSIEMEHQVTPPEEMPFSKKYLT